MDRSDFTQTVKIKGDDCPYDPERGVALIYCSNCGEENEVDVDVTDGVGSFMGFVCSKCGFWNTND